MPFTPAAWHIWMVIGIVCVIIEIFDPAFFFLALGIGAIATALVALAPGVAGNVVLQVVIFAVFSFIAFLLMRKLGRKVLSNPGTETNVNALIGKIGTVTRDIPVEGKGYVKIGGEEWSAVEQESRAVLQGARVEVLAIDGNKVVVRQVNQ